MAKWRKRLLIVAAFLLVALIALAGIGWKLVRDTPDWYRPDSMSIEQRDDAAQSATNKLAELQNRAAEIRASESAARYSRSPASMPSEMTISFTDDELNALLAKWSVWQSVRSGYQKFLTDPYIVLMDGKMILAGRIKEFDAVASIHFQPRIDAQGRLDVKVAQVLAGKLPIPQSTISDYQKQAADGLERRLPAWRLRASIDSTGIANNDTVSAAMGQLVMNILDQQPSEPVVFMEVISKGMVPMRISDLKIENHSVILKVQQMTASERQKLLASIRENSQ